MWRVWHKLFGWDYVLVRFGQGMHVCRIRKYPGDIEYIKYYGNIQYLNHPELNGVFSNRFIIHLTRCNEAST